MAVIDNVPSLKFAGDVPSSHPGMLCYFAYFDSICGGLVLKFQMVSSDKSLLFSKNLIKTFLLLVNFKGLGPSHVNKLCYQLFCS